MTTIEYLLNKMPYRLSFKKKEECSECGHEYWNFTQYRLKIDIFMLDGRNRYRIYYQTYAYGDFTLNAVIGEDCGLGYSTLKEALKSLLAYKNEIRGNYAR